MEVLHLLRITLVHAVYCGYPAFIWWRIIDIAEDLNWSSSDAMIACCVWYSVHVILQFLMCWLAIKDRPVMNTSWCLVFMLQFSLFTISPYMLTLKWLYDLEDKTLVTKVSNCTLQSDFHISIATPDYIMLQIAMVILLLTYIVYPFPRRAYELGAYLALAIEFLNAFDIMDMLGDLAFIRRYGMSWRAFYYSSLGISVLLLSFPIKIEEDTVDFPKHFIGWASRLVSQVKRRQRQHGGGNGDTKATGVKNCECCCEGPCVHPMKKRVGDGENIRSNSSQNIQQQISVSKDNNGIESALGNSNMGFQIEDIGTEVSRNSNRQAFSTKSQNAATIDHENTDTLQSTKSSSLPTSFPKAARNEASRSVALRECWLRIAKTTVTIVFTDVMFATVRFKIMVEEHSVEHGFNMVMKNLILALLHSFYLMKHVHTLVKLIGRRP